MRGPGADTARRLAARCLTRPLPAPAARSFDAVIHFAGLKAVRGRGTRRVARCRRSPLARRPGLTRAPRCASTAQVGESVALPLKYYNNNLVATLNLLDSMGRHGCKRVRPRPSRDSRLAPPHAHAAPHRHAASPPARRHRTHGG